MLYGQVIIVKKGVLIGLILFLVLPFSARCEELSVSAGSAVLYDPLTGSVLFEKDASVPRGIASTTKIMTAVAALEQYDPACSVTIRPEWCGIEGSSMELRPGETMQVSDLLYGLMLESGNDAATALAGLHPAGEAGFVARMNEIADGLGLENTHFDNASGLDSATHYSTALDLARLAAFAMDQPQFARIAATQSVTAAGRVMENHNRLLKDLGACGVKTGFTKSSGRCLVSAKAENGRMLIAVTLDDPNDWADHAALYRFGFGQYREYDPVGAGECGSVPLTGSLRSQVRVYCNESFSVLLQTEEYEHLRIVLSGPRFCYAPIEAGQRYGTLQVWLDGRVLFETPAYFAESIGESIAEKPDFLTRIRIFLRRLTLERTVAKNPFSCWDLFQKSS